MVSWEGLIGAEVFTLCLGARLLPTARRVGDPVRVVILGQSIASGHNFEPEERLPCVAAGENQG